jgi:hypothetical protein
VLVVVRTTPEIPKRTGCSEETAGIGWQHKPYVIVERAPARGRGKFVRLSEAGIKAQQEYYSWTRDIEEKWKKRFRTAHHPHHRRRNAVLHGPFHGPD